MAFYRRNLSPVEEFYKQMMMMMIGHHCIFSVKHYSIMLDIRFFALKNQKNVPIFLDSPWRWRQIREIGFVKKLNS